MNILLKIWNRRWMLRSIFSTIYFNFHYLPFHQAKYLPIGLYKCKILSMKGEIKIETEEPLKPGMISFGRYGVSIYPNNGFIYENHGGTIIFKGSCNIGNNSAISIGRSALAVFGDKFSASASLRLVCYNKIVFNERTRVGWECTIMDTDLHRMKFSNGGYTKGYGTIIIGKGNWFANRCVVLKNTKTSDYCTFSTGSVLNEKYETPYSVYSPNSIKLKHEGLYRDVFDDSIDYDNHKDNSY